MLLVDEDLDLLEYFLDGSLDAAEADLLRDRLSREGELAAALESVRAERALRQKVWAGLEPTDQEVDGLADRVKRDSRRRAWTGRSWRIAAAIAACVGISFFAGWELRGGKPVTVADKTPSQLGPKVEKVVSYQVALTDEKGRVTAVQNFDSLEKAREFANDVGRWQERREQMRDGAAVVVADRF